MLVRVCTCACVSKEEKKTINPKSNDTLTVASDPVFPEMTLQYVEDVSTTHLGVKNLLKKTLEEILEVQKCHLW